MPYCLIFPGQGSQFPGMSKGLELNKAVGVGLRSLMENGPDEELGRTIHAQPSVLSVSAALWERSGLTDPAAVMGHSLGEYTALVAAGSIATDGAIDLVTRRAEFMEASGAGRSGGMAAVIGMSEHEVEQAIAAIDDLWVANLNGVSQVVISGNTGSIEAAAVLLKGRGAKRVVPLKVSVASHCPHMDKARDSLAEHLKGIRIGTPGCPVIANASARPETDPERIRLLLSLQLTSPVRFEESVRTALGMGIDSFVEIGPRSVLAALIKRIAPGAKVEVIANDGH